MRCVGGNKRRERNFLYSMALLFRIEDQIFYNAVYRYNNLEIIVVYIFKTFVLFYLVFYFVVKFVIIK